MAIAGRILEADVRERGKSAKSSHSPRTLPLLAMNETIRRHAHVWGRLGWSFIGVPACFMLTAYATAPRPNRNGEGALIIAIIVSVILAYTGLRALPWSNAGSLLRRALVAVGYGTAMYFVWLAVSFWGWILYAGLAV